MIYYLQHQIFNDYGKYRATIWGASIGWDGNWYAFRSIYYHSSASLDPQLWMASQDGTWVYPDGVTTGDLVNQTGGSVGNFLEAKGVPTGSKFGGSCLVGTVDLQEYVTDANNLSGTAFDYLVGVRIIPRIGGYDDGGTDLFNDLTNSQTTFNSPSCFVYFDDLSIDSIKVTGTGPYTVTINASGSWTTFSYSLTNDTYQVSNTFNVTNTGDYTAYVTDAQGYKRSQRFRIYPDYGAKFKITAKDEFNNTLLCEIFEKGYSGATTEINGTRNFCNITAGSSNADKWKVISGRTAQLNILSESDFQFIDLLTGEEDKYYLKVTRASTEIFRGMLIPEGYRERYEAVPYDISFRFFDGLGNLKNQDFTDVFDEPFKGYKSQLEIIRLCLQKTYFNLGFKIALDYFENNHTQTSGNTPLEQTYMNSSDFTGMDCYEVIESILTPHFCKLYQSGGYWHIKNINSIQTTYNEEQFDNNGTWEQTNSTSDVITTTTATASPLIRIMAGANLEFQKGLKLLTIEQDNPKKRDLYKIDWLNYDAFREDFSGRGGWYSKLKELFFPYEVWNYVGISQDYFNGVGDIYKGRTKAKFIKEYNSQAPNVLTSYAWGNFGRIVTILDGTTRDVSVELKFDYNVNLSSNSNYEIRFNYVINIGQYYYDVDNSVWTTTETLNEIRQSSMNEWITYEIITKPIVNNGDLVIRFYPPDAYDSIGTNISDTNLGTYYFLGDFDVQFTDSSNKLDKINYFLKNTATYSDEKTIDLKFGERSDVQGSQDVFTGIPTLDSNGETITSSWNRLGNTDALPLVVLFAKDISNQYSRPFRKLTCNLRYNGIINEGTIIQEYYDSNRKYLVTQVKYNCASGDYSLNLLEYITENNSLYLLKEDGFNFLLEDGSGKILLES